MACYMPFMRRPDRPTDRPGVVDLNARRRAAELQKQALKGAGPRRRAPDLSRPAVAWALLLLAALVLALIRWLPQVV